MASPSTETLLWRFARRVATLVDQTHSPIATPVFVDFADCGMFDSGQSRHFRLAVSICPLDPNDLTLSTLIDSSGECHSATFHGP
jgi:hypothetical protein